MLTVQKGAIKKFTLPDGFVLGEEEYGGMGYNWRRRYVPGANNEVAIISYYRGSEEPASDGEVFRHLLSKPPHLIYREGETDRQAALSTLYNLAPIIGGAGNNNLVNQRTGLSGPRFHLEIMRTLKLGGRTVLEVAGWFHGASGELHNYYDGILFDGDSASAGVAVEELLFEAQTKQLFDRYWPAFLESLKSIEWV